MLFFEFEVIFFFLGVQYIPCFHVYLYFYSENPSIFDCTIILPSVWAATGVKHFLSFLVKQKTKIISWVTEMDIKYLAIAL